MLSKNDFGLLDENCKAHLIKHAKRTILNDKRTRQEGWVINTFIRELCVARRISQEELASAVGTTRQTITSIETGKYTASLPLAYKIARYFDRSIEEVFDFSEWSCHGKDSKATRT